MSSGKPALEVHLLWWWSVFFFYAFVLVLKAFYVRDISLPSFQLNQSQTSVAGLVELLSGRRRLWALGELAAIESGYRQAVELKHSYPQVGERRHVLGMNTVFTMQYI